MLCQKFNSRFDFRTTDLEVRRTGRPMRSRVRKNSDEAQANNEVREIFIPILSVDGDRIDVDP